MFQSWRFKLREAEQALRDGRLDDAGAILQDSELGEYLPGKRLSAQVAGRITERACRRIRDGESSAGWRDLEFAHALAGDSDQWLNARQQIIDLAVQDAEHLLAAGETAQAIQRLESLEKRQVRAEPLRRLLEIARRLESARNLSRRGKFAEAELQLATAESLRPAWPLIGKLRDTCQRQLEQARTLTERLHAAVTSGEWTAVLSLADQLLDLAPESKLAVDARQRAWLAVGRQGGDLECLRASMTWTPSMETRQQRQAAIPQDGPRGERFRLWVDGVGGYLVCLGDDILLGQAAPGNPIDVAFQADMSRRHARIRRCDGYLLEPFQRVRIGGREIFDISLLRDGDEIELGEHVRLRFRQPHALSATARLEVLSRHRLEPAADAVLLMAESCVLGPKWQNHVVCREWSNDVVLYRHDGQLSCRVLDRLEIDGAYCAGRGRLNWDSHVCGDDFSFSLEPLGS
jgi:hypothetical protein